ncbi:MAG: DUF2442 domain-containing protein [Geminicoccaceae bacterium]|nr:DUF2442 domain-containing protein [Geminicoccaceae bacterium]
MKRKMPRIVRAVATGRPFELDIEWSTGERMNVDVSEAADGPYEPLRDASLFARARADDWGHRVVWIEDEIDLGADQLYRWSLEQAGEAMTVEDWREWRARNRLSVTGAAAAIGISRRMATYYEKGEWIVPKTIRLACSGYEMEQAG